MEQGSDKQGSETAQAPRFKIVGKVAMAIQRFRASINPNYHFGKRATDAAAEHDAQLKAALAKGAVHSKDRTASGRTISGRPTSAGQAHGHKGHLLFRALPEIETEAQ